MTDQKRDESKDAGILWDTDEFESDHEVEPWDHRQYDTRFVRYVPHSDLVAAEQAAFRDILDLTKRNDVLNKLLTKALGKLHEVANWRSGAHAYDDDMGHEPREFGDEAWDAMEGYATNVHQNLCNELEGIK